MVQKLKRGGNDEQDLDEVVPSTIERPYTASLLARKKAEREEREAQEAREKAEADRWACCVCGC